MNRKYADELLGPQHQNMKLENKKSYMPSQLLE